MGRTSVKPAPIPTSEIVGSYTPIVRAYLVTAFAYNGLICFSHPVYEIGWNLVILESLAIAAVLVGVGFWWSLKHRPTGLLKLEVAAASMNALFLANVVAYQTIHFEAPKLVYFVLLGLAFATAAPTRRVALLSVAAATACLVVIARNAPGDLINHYAFIGVAGAFTAIGMATLMRGAVLRELRARLASDALNRILELELTENQRLRTEAQELALSAQTANRVKTEFLATMSHEIRTPLNGVLGTAQAMERGELPEDQRRRLGLIQTSGQSLLQVINAILDISQIEAGRMEIRPAPFNLDGFAEGLRQLYVGLAQAKGLELRLTVDESVRGWRIADEQRLRQVISNLISNAIKFTDAGGIAIRISGDAQDLVCTVEDSGVGIPADRRGQIFEKFVQMDSSTTRRSGGSGLGLAICRELLTLMGGSIGFESLPAGGTRFIFQVPSPVTSDRPAGTDVAANTAMLNDHGLRILVVDDNQTNRIVLEAMLDHLDIATGLACDGREAVALWESSHWDAILMDVNMPGMDGLEASREIRSREALAGRVRTPIIAVTASVLAHETERYFSAGMDGVVAKPIEIKQLIAALDAALTDPAAAPVAIAV
ncbi:MAG: ATP-binding protein [Caulobacter sp.]|nr:ATP-binding protein [Caulobacter sp.]